MSRCIECLQEMDALDARQYYECGACRAAKKRCTKVPSVNQKGSEECGRTPLSFKAVGGCAEGSLDWDRDDDSEDSQ